MFCKLFYDKYAGDHLPTNPKTQRVSIEDLESNKYTHHIDDAAVKFYNSKFNGHFSIPETVLTSNLYQMHVYEKTVNGADMIFLVVGVNSKILERLVQNNLKIPDEKFLKMLCRFHHNYTVSIRLDNNTYAATSADTVTTNTNFVMKKAMIAEDYSCQPEIENQDEISTQLYKYQKCTVQWALNKEKKQEVIRYNLNDEVLINNVYYDIQMKELKLTKDRNKLTFKGGVIADEVGLGKTIQAITLALKNHAVDCSYTHSSDPEHLYSRATLIICPSHLCKQWEREILNMVRKDYKPVYYLFPSKREFNKYTYSDLLDADFVIVPTSFLDNPAFTAAWTSTISAKKNFSRSFWDSTDIASVATYLKTAGKKLYDAPMKALYATDPIFMLIHWHRIFVDEFHEVNTNKKYTHVANLMPFFKSTYTWGVTATPFISQANSLNDCVNLLTGYTNMDGKQVMTCPDVVDYLSTECFRRNTKESIKQEYTIPNIVEKVVWLKFSATERMMYNAHLADLNNNRFSEYLRQLCCHPQLADETKMALNNCKTLADIENMMVGHYCKEMNIATTKVNRLKTRAAKINKNKIKLKKRGIKRMKKKAKKMQKQNRRQADEDSSDSDSDSDSDSESDKDNNDDDDDNNDENINIEDDEMIVSRDKISSTEELEELPDEDTRELVRQNRELDNDIAAYNAQNIMFQAHISLTNYNDALSMCRDRLVIAKKELQGKAATYKFFKTVMERLKTTAAKETDSSKKKNFDNCDNADDLFADLSDSDEENDEEEPCVICLGQIPEDDIGVTRCGHVFCYKCLKTFTMKSNNCAMCKQRLTSKDIYVLSYERKKKHVSKEDKKKDDMINEIGTKLANLVFLLKDEPEHTIIFSQWDDLLRRVGGILADNGVKNTFCKGNVYQRDKAVRDFDSDESIQVIMLSSAKSASGTNLTKAKRIVFLDPIFGANEDDHKHRKDQETQAIGRAHRMGQKNIITVIRMNIKDTVEEEIYKMNQKEDAKNAVKTK